MKPIAALCRFHDAMADFGYIVGSVGLASMATIYCYEVLTRYFLGVATDWANDAFSNVLCVTIFSVVPHATRRGAHISISLLIEMVPKTGPSLKIFTGIVGTAMCCFAAWMGFQENVRQITMGITTPDNHPVPSWWMSVWITFGFLGAAFYFLRGLFDHPAVKPVSWITPPPPEVAPIE